MAEKKILMLSDKDVIPTEDYILSILGDKKEFWKSIIKNATEEYKDTSGTWNYYNDGKNWLFKMVQKKKHFSGAPYILILSELPSISEIRQSQRLWQAICHSQLKMVSKPQKDTVQSEQYQ